ncbi:MAG: uroporphyrinogen-III C-methyltransferase [Zoogloeaceae bacterium]|jgi:uroporphyrin-III C-methyltransferase/precorrin-2 dehydrogenase/sirohydrochlorin ferrochelatase|nr:uroporphyrinogen-III C-methyltransferase [Zoogloeaceae bacterium]
MNILPLALTPKRILLIGAGRAAAQKARAILESDCALGVIACEMRDPFFWENRTRFAEIMVAPFDLQHVQGWDILVNATGDTALSRILWAARKTHGYWLNCVDQPEFCDFYFGATVRDHALCVSVSSGGASPRYAQRIRDLIAAVLPRQSAAFYQALTTARARKKTGTQINAAQIQTQTGKVFLIGCGPGSRDNLTLRALNLLPFLEVALIDALVDPEIVALLPPDCRRIDVSKRKGKAAFTQEEINAQLLAIARQGLRVGRLKGGDPMLFGRVFEEAAFLLEHGIVPEIVNGVSSFLAGCRAGGIPPTLRTVSTGTLVVSAHLKETRFNEDWIPFLNTLPYTVIVLMAWSFAARIRESARRHGVPLTLPAAFVAHIDRPEQTTILGTLDQLEEMAAQCATPAILVIGEAVAHARQLPYTGRRIVLE